MKLCQDSYELIEFFEVITVFECMIDCLIYITYINDRNLIKLNGTIKITLEQFIRNIFNSTQIEHHFNVVKWLIATLNTVIGNFY